MFRQVSIVALVVLVAVGSLTVATAEEPKEAGGKTKACRRNSRWTSAKASSWRWS